MRDASGFQAALAHLDLGWTRTLPAVHARIEAPVHLFWGGADREYFPLRRACKMQKEFRKRGELMVIPHGKWLVHEEAHEVLSRFCFEMLVQRRKRRRTGLVRVIGDIGES